MGDILVCPELANELDFSDSKVFEQNSDKIGSKILYQGLGCLENKQAGWKYEGLFEKGLFCGKGKIEFSRDSSKQQESKTNSLQLPKDCTNPTHPDQHQIQFDAEAGDSYQGSFKGNKFHGTGIYSYSNGDSYSGEFIDGKRTTGILKFVCGDEYAGDFDQKGLYCGYSLYRQANGDTYCGDWLEGKRHGNGVLKLKA